MEPRRKNGRRGFSLVEMLIVIGLIAVLVALLLPAVSRARSKAKMTDCASQLRQIYLASQTWKVQHDPEPIQATGWRTAYKPIVQDLRVYVCAETNAAGTAAVAGDKAGTVAAPSGGSAGTAGGSGTTGGGAGTGAGPAADPNAPSLADAYVHIDPHNGQYWDVPVKEGPWFQKKNASGNSYELWLEDMGFQGGGDRDFLDVGLKVTDNGDGSCTITLLPQPPGKGSSYDSYLKAPGADGQPKDVFTNMYKNPAFKGGETAKMNGPFDPNDPSAGSHAPGTDPTGAGTGGSGPSASSGYVGTDGSGEPSDYGLNANLYQVDGNADKVYGMDYTFSVVQPDKDDWATDPKFTRPGDKRPLFARHLGYANIVYGDGSVRASPITTTNLNPAIPANRYDYFTTDKQPASGSGSTSGTGTNSGGTTINQAPATK